MSNLNVMPNALAVGVLSVLLTACGGGVEKPDLSTPSTPTVTPNTNNNYNSLTQTTAPANTSDLGLDVRLVNYIGADGVEYDYLTDDGKSYAKIKVSVLNKQNNNNLTEEFNIAFDTTCPSNITNPAVVGTDFTIGTSPITITKTSDGTASVKDILITPKNVTGDKTVCFNITSVNGDTNHTLIQNTKAGFIMQGQTKPTTLSLTALIKDMGANSNNNSGNGGNSDSNGGNNSDNNGSGNNNQDTTTKKTIVNHDSNMAFVKLDNTGTKVEDSATDWACFRDETTGLLWETKDATPDKVNSISNSYFFYDKTRNYGSDTKTSNWITCPTLSNCNTQAYIDKINEQKLCGVDNWRLPTYHELFNIANLTGATGKDIYPSQIIKNGELTRGTFWTSSPLLTSNSSKMANDTNEATYTIAYFNDRSIVRSGSSANPSSNYGDNGIVLVSDGK